MASTPSVRGLRDEAAVGPDPSQARDLKRLSDLRYEVADGEPDIRGWTVYSSAGREIGIVSDLLVDTDAGEVVMLDVDLRRHDQHTLAPIRAAWVDHATRRVVLDARALAGALGASAPASVDTTAAVPVALPAAVSVPEARDTREAHTQSLDAGPALPALPRSGPLTDADVQRFDQEYVRTYGDRAVDPNTTWRVPRGSNEALQFAPRRLIEPDQAAVGPTPGAGMSGAGMSGAGMSGAGAGSDALREREALTERRSNRVDDASALDDAAGIDPRELDARVRIDEGATVDDAAPVAGVRYEGDEHTPHTYGRPDEAYGAEYGSGRIGFNRVVTREPYAGDRSAEAADTTGEPLAAERARAVRYRRYDDRYAGPDDTR